MLQGRIKHGGKVFRDPIHQLIRIDPEDEFIIDLIDTPEFQRLRRIRQLGVSWLTYPGAEHSRFVHSLGVFNFVQRMLHSLRRRYFDDDVGKYLEENGKIVKAAALLHDVGHGPFSHMIERAIGSTMNHESKTVALIKDPDGGIGQVCARHGIDAQEVAALIQHTSSHSLLVDLVTSQLDADRMDYLLRDSYCTGVQYGKYDPEWLINALCVGKNPIEVEGNEPHRAWRLALDERRGERAAEQFILARAHMNDQVYFHRVTRGFEALLLNLFQIARNTAISSELPIGTPSVVSKYFRGGDALSREDWLGFDESSLFAAFHAWGSNPSATTELARLSRAFLNRERVYKCVSIAHLDSMTQHRVLTALRDDGLTEGQHWHLDDAKSTVYKDILYSIRAKQIDDEEEMQVESILLASGSPKQRARAIETSSELMKHLAQQKQSALRLYFHRTSEVETTLKKFKLRPDSGGESE